MHIDIPHTIKPHQSPQGCKAVLRMGNISNNKNDGPNIAVTDNGNYIVDLFFTSPIADVALAAKELKATVGNIYIYVFVYIYFYVCNSINYMYL
jgi:ribose 5-phosphate isomerase A